MMIWDWRLTGYWKCSVVSFDDDDDDDLDGKIGLPLCM